MPSARLRAHYRRFVLGAAPGWFNNNLVAIAAVVLAVVGVLLLRMVRRASARLILCSILAGLLLFVVLQRDELSDCGRTCSCRVVTVDVDVPGCDSDQVPGG
jgi:predicted membrane metal-binding protein